MILLSICNAIDLIMKPPLSGKPCKAFKVKADAPVTDLVLELEKGASIAGKVLDADGAPVSGVYVQCWAQDGQGGQANETTGADGTYKLDGDKLELGMKFGGDEKKETLTVKKLTDTELETADSKGKTDTFTKVAEKKEEKKEKEKK